MFGLRLSILLVFAVQLKWSDFKNDRLLYTMHKNQKPVSLKIPDKAAEILNKYKSKKSENNGYIFPFLKDINTSNEEELFKKMRNATKLFNKYLKRIAEMCNIDKKLYRHSDLKTTLNYQANFIHKDADEALDNVINF